MDVGAVMRMYVGYVCCSLRQGGVAAQRSIGVDARGVNIGARNWVRAGTVAGIAEDMLARPVAYGAR
jgi:hypothetical protein